MASNNHIPIRNIYYMLSYAFSSLKLRSYENLAAEEFENIYNLMAAILYKGIGRQIKQGLYREYVDHRDNLAGLRGKIHMPGTIQNRMAHKQLINCQFDELSENIPLNQILKTTITLLSKCKDVDAKYKDDLASLRPFFSGIDTIDPASIRWDTIPYQRNNSSYRMLISFCQLILEGMLITTDTGEYRLANFLDDQQMSHLYEKFILEYYVQTHPELKASASQIPWDVDCIDPYLPTMQSDVMLTKGDKTLIIDAKYYSRTMQTNFGVSKIRSANLYQIFAYVKNAAAHSDHPEKISGMLLYAKTDEEIQPDSVYTMGGNQIHVRTLDLNQKFEKIKTQLDGIAAEYLR